MFLISLSLFQIIVNWGVAYLGYCDSPQKADLIVLFLGPEREDRKKEAFKLIEDGYAETVFVPAATIEFRRNCYPDYYENTHIEIICVKKFMEKMGFKSAIMVSSSFHMRRIRMISTVVFEDMQYQLTFRGSRNSTFKSYLPMWDFILLRRMAGEYIKMMVFCGYHFFESGLLGREL